jgi:biofilm PGA synthesis N-glycosyltransferase PgaC
MMGILDSIGEVVIAFVALYPILTASIWMAGGVLFRLLDERLPHAVERDGTWPGVTVLIPAFNEAAVIARSIEAARNADYPDLEVLVLDDGSTDRTAAVATHAAAGDRRVRVIRDETNIGKADRLNHGVREAGKELIVVIDADSTPHPEAIKRLVRRITLSPRIAAVAGAPQIANRGSVLAALQVLEFSSIVGLIRRTQALGGRVGVVAGVVGIFRREAILEVGGYDGRMATEDIELTYRLLLAGWETDFEPNAMVGMEVPSSWRALWMQRTRWSRGQGEVLRVHWRSLLRLRNHRMWLIAGESLASMVWLVLAATSLVLAGLDLVSPEINFRVFGFALAWGVAIAVVATIQLAVSMTMEIHYDRSAAWTFLLGPLYPAAYWGLAAAAALRSEVPAIIRGPRDARVVWDMPRPSSVD